MPKKASLLNVPSWRSMGLASGLATLILLCLPMYFVRFRIGPLPTNLLEVSIGLFVLAVLYEVRQAKRQLVFPYWQPIALILIGILIGVTVAVDERAALGIFKGWFLLPILFGWGIANIVNKDNSRAFVFALFANALFVGFYALLQRYGYVPLIGHQLRNDDLLQYLPQGRALGFFESPNYLAMYLTPILVFLGLYTASTRVKSNAVWLISLLIPLAAVYLSGSRAAFITLVLFLIPLCFLPFRHKKWMWLAGIPLFLLAIVIILLRVKVNIDGIDSLRVGIWQTALHLINQHPLTGIGAGQFSTYFAQNPYELSQNLLSAAQPFAIHAHSLYLSMWLAGGALSFIGLIWLLFAVGVHFHLTDKPRTVLLFAAYGAFLSFFIQGFFDSTYFKNDLSVLFWFFVMVAWHARSRNGEAT